MEIKEMTVEELVEKLVEIDRRQREDRAKANVYKAELQARGTALMDDRSIKYVKFFGENGTVSVMESLTLDVLNIDRLRSLLEEGVFKTKVKEEVKVDYKFDSKLEKALKAIFTGDYLLNISLEEFFDEMTVKPDEKQRKLLLRKLKGDFEKDKETLISVLGYGDYDVELWYIYRIKNGELIKAFLTEDANTESLIQSIRKCIMVETKTAITLDYDKEKKDE